MRTFSQWIVRTVPAAVCILAASMLSAQKGTNGEWSYYGGDLGSTRYSVSYTHLDVYKRQTTGNKDNPDPNQWIGYGDRTIDEMGHAWVNVTNISDQEYADWAAKHKAGAKMARGGQ